MTVGSDVLSFVVYREVKLVSPREAKALASGYIWLDWFSIPQITARQQCEWDSAALVLGLRLRGE